MARLPTPGSDDNVWGAILNEFLSVEHNTDGTLKATGSLTSKADDSTVIHLSGNETISGTKTFNLSPAIPNPTLPTQAANKSYVDSVATGAPDATASTKGIIQLTGDLGGTATSPTVPGLSAKEPALTATTSADYYRGDKTFQPLNKTVVGLGNVDNTSDINKPVSTPQATADGLRVLKTGDTMTGPFAVAANGNAFMLGDGTNTDVYTIYQGVRGYVGYGNSSMVIQGGVSKGVQIAVNNATFASGVVAAWDTTGRLGLLTTVPTHSLTLGSTGSGLALYNTVDQITNYERIQMAWASNTFTITSSAAGTGTNRSVAINSANTIMTVSSSGVIMRRDTTGITALFQITSTGLNSATITQIGLKVDPTVIQSGSAGYTALLVNPTESTVGSGQKLIADFQVGGNSKVTISNAGAITVVDGGNIVAGTTTGTKIGTATTQKIGFYNTTPIVQPTGNILTALAALGIVATPSLTNADVGLFNVDNTSDASKNTATTTLTNKTLVQPIVRGTATVPLTDGAAIDTDASLGNIFTVTLGGNRTINNPSGVTDGQKIVYRIKQDGTGSRTVVWDANFRFSTDIPSPTLTITAAKTDYIGFIYNATDTKWDCLAVTKGF